MPEPSVVFDPDGKKWPLTIGKTVLDLVREATVDLQATCIGRGECGKCRVIITDGQDALVPLTEFERQVLSSEEIALGYRLACRASVRSLEGFRVEVPAESRISQQRLLSRGIEVHIQPKPLVTKEFIRVKEPSLQDIRSDTDRLFDTLNEVGFDIRKIPVEAVAVMPEVLRKSNWAVTTIIRKSSEIAWLEAGDTRESNFGLALDIGTTKIAGYLVNLNSGSTVETAAIVNPQITYGEDVISRISAIMEDPKKLMVLQRVVVKAANRLLKSMCDKAGITPYQIYDVLVVGNTAMHHIFFGISPKYVSLSPYPAVVRASVDVEATKLGLNVNPSSQIHSLPNVAGFVGADAIADIISTQIHKMNVLSMIIDVGTNTEVILGDRNGLVCCSCPSGPAWEGAHIRNGMRAEIGAIESIWIDPATLAPKYEVIGKTKPRGICGSGIVDAVAEMLKSHIIDLSGLISDKINNTRVRIEPKREYIVAGASETTTKKDIMLTQEDIREVQLAKAAIYAGTVTLMKKSKVQLLDIQKIFIAGAFGTYMNVQNAQIIGLFPDIPLNRIRFVGNAAGSGARMALISSDIRQEADEIAIRMRSRVELGVDPDFRNEFLKATKFPNSDTHLFPNVRRILGI